MSAFVIMGVTGYYATAGHAADPNAEPIAEGIQSFADSLGGLDGLDQLASKVPFTDLLPSGNDGLALGQVFAQSLRDRLATQLAGAGFDDLSDLQDFLNDPDGANGDNDDGTVAGVTVDIGGTVVSSGSTYQITLTLSAARGGTTPLALPLTGVDASGGALTKDLGLNASLSFEFDPAQPLGSRFALLTATPQALTASLDVDLGATPYDIDLGLTKAAVTGTADIGTDVVATIVDPTPNGRITSDDWDNAAPADLFDVAWGPSHANLSLTLTSDIAGAPTGTITLADTDLSNGITTPTVSLGNLADFKNMTPQDFLGGLANIAGALDALQLTGPADLDLPLMKDRLSDVLTVGQRVKDFFTSTGLSDVSTPLTLGPGPGQTQEQYAAKLASFDTIQEVRGPLALALGVPVNLLGFAFNGTTRQLSLTIKKNETRSPLTAHVDLANQLERFGLTGVEDATSTISLTPTVDLDFGVNVDLSPVTAGQSLLGKFALETAGRELAVDAPVTGNLDLVGKVGFLGLTLADGNSSGTVDLLAPKTAGTPMLSVDIDGGPDNVMTLPELFTLASAAPTFSGTAGSINVGVNAKVPSFDLVASARANGTEIASGVLTLAWPDVTTGAPTVSGDADFNDELLDFDFDHTDPLALFNQITTALSTFAAAVDGLADQAAGAVLKRDLPFAGQSFDDIANKLTEVSTAVNELIADPPATLQVLEKQLEAKIGTALGIAPADWEQILGISVTHNSPTAIVFDLSYGLCAIAGPGCTKVTGPLHLPFNFNLGDATGGIVGAGGNGAVDLTYKALASLDFGITLPEVTGNPALGQVPSVAGSPSAFVVDTSAASLSASLTAGGSLTANVGPLNVFLGKTGDPIAAKLAAGITLDNDIAPAGPTRIAIGSPDFTSFVTGLVPTDIGPADADRVTCPAPVDGTYDACARIPVYLNETDATPLGTITLSWNDLNQLSGADGPVFSGVEDLLDALVARGLDFTKVFEGMQKVLQLITDTLDAGSYGAKVPVVGDALSAGAKVTDFLNTEVVTPLNNLSAELSGVTPDAVRLKIQDFFVTALQVPAADGDSLLLDRAGTTAGPDRDDVVVNVLCDDGVDASGGDLVDGPTPCTSAHAITALYDVQIGFGIGQTGATGTPVDFDLGMPGLRLEMVDDDTTTADDLKAKATWKLDLAFGLSVRDGFYLRTDNPNSTGPELSLDAGLELPDTLHGDIAFLPFALTDRTDSTATPADPDDLHLAFAADLKGGGTQHRLSLTDLLAGIDPGDDASVDPSLTGYANLDFHFITGALEGETSSLPTFIADFLLNWDFTTGDVLEGDIGNLKIEFNNVGIDLGSLLGSFLKPILKEAAKITKPLQPVVDIVTAPIPGLSDAAAAFGCPATLPFPEIIADIDLCKISLLDIYEKMSGTDLTLIRQLISLINFINAVDGAGDQGVPLILGSFKVTETAAAGSPLSGNVAGDKLLESASGPLEKPLEKLTGAIKGVVADAKKEGADKGGFTFPAFEDPTRLFKLLLGQDVTLVHWDAGFLEAKVTIPLEIGPPIGPLPISLGITIQFGVRGHFAVGYDTRGIRKAVERLTNDDPNDDGFLETVGTLFAGIGIDDRVRVNGEPTGEDIPEITLFGSLTAKAALDLLIVEAGVRGGVKAELNANLHDGGLGPEFHSVAGDTFSHFPENLDGVLRLDEIASFLGNPLCLFDYDGKITAFLEAYIDYTLDEETFTIVGPVTLYDFGELLAQACETEPVLAHVDGSGNLILHSGTFADLREFQEGEEKERFVVRQLDAAGTKFSVTAFGYTQEYGGVSGFVFGDGAGGDDTISLEPGSTTALGDEPQANGPPGDTIISTVIPFTRRAYLCGGPGVDVLSAGSGGDTLIGDGVANESTLTCSTTEAATDGRDDLTGAAGGDTIWGMGAGDKIKGGDGGDAIDGGTGDDAVLGGGQGTADAKDIIRGGPDSTSTTDKDTIFAALGDDEVDGGADKDTIDGDVGADKLRGGPGDDKITGQAGADTISGEGDNDLLYGSDGDDIINGGDGDDDAFGEAGDDTINGGAHNDDLIGGRDNTGTAGDSDVGDKVNGDGGDDDIVGDEGTIVRPAGQATGTIVCTGVFAGDDTLNGGDDKDIVLGCSGVDTMHGNKGDDLMYGSGGGDKMFGDDGIDTMFGDAGADDMEGNADADTMRGGDEDDVMRGNGGTDTMFGDSGADLMKGNADNDVMRGNAGIDTMEGNGGSDTMNGDDGNDVILGGTSAAAQLDTGDYLYGNTGEDLIIGDNGSYTGTLFDLLAPVDPTFGGKDYIEGGTENDRAYGGLDDDTVYGGDGEDVLEGNNASDLVNGDGGADNIIGGTSQLNGSASYPDAGDELYGNAGDDVILGDNGSLARAAAGAGTDVTRARGLTFERTITLYDLGYSPDAAKFGADKAYGGDGPDVVLGQGGDEIELEGNAADDFVAGGQGADLVRGNAGQDDLLGGSYVLQGSASGQDRDGQLDAGDTVYGGDAGDVVLGDNGTVLRTLPSSEMTQNRTITERFIDIYDLTSSAGGPQPGTSGADYLLGEGDPDVILGQDGGDRVIGGPSRDFVEGGQGSDWIEGNEGRDDLVGGSSVITTGTAGRSATGQPDAADVVWGGPDDDLEIGDNAVVTRTGTPDELTARLGTNPTGALTDPRAVRLLDLGGEVGSTGTLTAPLGRFGDDHLSGQRGVDLILGQDGADKISGGSGDDYAEGQGADDSMAGDAALTTVLAATWPGDATPGYADDGGPAGQDELIGGKSEPGFRDLGDAIDGNGESDFALGDNGTAVRDVTGPAGSLVDRVYTLRYGTPAPGNAAKVRRADTDFPSTRFCAATGTTCERTGSFGGDTIRGDSGDDFLYGQDGSDFVFGGAQDDDIYGELGNDLLFGEAGEDAIVGDRGGIQDRYENGSRTFFQSVTQVPKVEYEGFSNGSVTRVVDLLHDVNGDAFVGSGATAKMPHNGLEEGGEDRIRGGLDNDSIHGGFGDDLANGDSGGDSLFGGDGADVMWGGKGCDATVDTPATKPVCFTSSGAFIASPHNAAGETIASVTDYLLGGKGATSGPSIAAASGSDVLDWRPRGVAADCTANPWPVDVTSGKGKSSVTTTKDPCSWFEMTDINNAGDGDNQHHQGVDWQYGGWDRDVMQGDEADNGPNEGDRLLDWNGAYNLYTHCNSAYGGFNDVRQHSPGWQSYLQKWVNAEGAGQALSDTTTPGTSAFVELALVYPGSDNAHGSGSAYPSTPGHFDNPNACAP